MGGSGGKLGYEKVDLSGKTAIVTGANSGIGYVTARDLMLMGARVIIACRSETKAKAAMLRLQADATEKLGEEKAELAQVEFIRLDLASLQSVVDFAEEFKSKGYPLQLLICNGGIMSPEKVITKDNYEQHFQVNYLSHFLLTLHLLPIMRNSGPDCRIINVSSYLHAYGSLDLSNIQAQKTYDPLKFYNNSKFFQILNMYSLQRRLEDSNISVFSLHPGLVETPMLLEDFRAVSRLMAFGVRLAQWFGMTVSVDQGAMTTLHVATNPLVPKIKGSYFDACLPITPAQGTMKPRDQEAFWNYSLELLHGYVPNTLLVGMTVDVEQLTE